jgi:hypothetical protein
MTGKWVESYYYALSRQSVISQPEYLGTREGMQHNFRALLVQRAAFLTSNDHIGTGRSDHDHHRHCCCLIINT